jgi:hypothetical protein
MSRAFDDFNEGKFSKQHLGMLSSRPNFEIQLMVRIIIMCLSPKVFIRFGVGQLNIQRCKVRYFCVLNVASLDHYFAAKKNKQQLYFGHVMIFCYYVNNFVRLLRHSIEVILSRKHLFLLGH